MSKRIVVVDDEQDIVEIIKATLRTKGYHIYPATDGEEGLRLIQQQKPDLIICDLKMPKISGLELTRRIRASEDLKDIPILIISAITKETGKSEEFWRVGLKADDFISKPFDPLDLLGRVEYIFRKKLYVSTAGNSGDTAAILPKESSAQAPHSEDIARMDMRTMTPDQVVQSFVEAWNRQDFTREYHAMGEEMSGALNEADYISSRKSTFNQNQDLRQRVVKIEESSIHTNIAKVIIQREDVQGQKTNRLRQQFALKKTQMGWKIISVRNKPA